MRVAAYPGREFRGAVEKIEPQAVVDQNVTMFAVLIDIGNEEGLLRPGMNVDAVFEVAERRRFCSCRSWRCARSATSMRPPGFSASMPDVCASKSARPGAGAQARSRDGDRAGAMQLGRGLWVVAVRDGREMPTPVETGITDLDRVEITGGLAEGSEVMLLPTASLVEIEQQIQDVASRRGGIPGLTQKSATAGAPQAPPARER